MLYIIATLAFALIASLVAIVYLLRCRQMQLEAEDNLNAVVGEYMDMYFALVTCCMCGHEVKNCCHTCQAGHEAEMETEQQIAHDMSHEAAAVSRIRAEVRQTWDAIYGKYEDSDHEMTEHECEWCHHLYLEVDYVENGIAICPRCSKKVVKVEN
jgi:hypothetical protein